MNLNTNQRRRCEQIINVFETGSAEGDYSNISIYPDGPHGIRQITYGRAQTTEYGNLRELVSLYVAANGTYSSQLAPYLNKIGSDPNLVNNSAFKKLLKDAGRNDPKMRSTQDKFFDKRYFKPAMKWADDNGFTEALSALVIYDSFIHSGSILWAIRNKFQESPPAAGGNERAWITAYVNARHNWLANHPRAILHATVYRTKCFKREIARNNWDLSQTPINANGVMIS
jgi:chitosanase